MEIKYNLTGTERKALVKTVSNIIGEKFKYLGAPSFAYQIGDDCTVTSDGTLKISNDTDNDKVEHLLEKLYECGYEIENDENIDIADTNKDFESETIGCSLDCRFQNYPINLATDKIIANLKAIIAGKMTLFQKAVGTDKELKVEWNKDEIWFDWFDSVIPNKKLGLYISLFKALYQMAEKAVRVNTKDKPVDNEKFAMRTFLNRIGLSGIEYKPLRKELMRNLSGDGAFRYGRPERYK